MRTILAMVMAEKEGNIESKMMRARHMEEIREAKRVEAEKRVEGKRASLEEKKSEIKGSEIKGNKRRKAKEDSLPGSKEDADDVQTSRKSKKRVSFG